MYARLPFPIRSYATPGFPWLGASDRRTLRGIDRFVDLCTEVFLQLKRHLLRQIGSRVVHSHDDAL